MIHDAKLGRKQIHEMLRGLAPIEIDQIELCRMALGYLNMHECGAVKALETAHNENVHNGDSWGKGVAAIALALGKLRDLNERTVKEANK